jgi:hypothetical protein
MSELGPGSCGAAHPPLFSVSDRSPDGAKRNPGLFFAFTEIDVGCDTAAAAPI